MPVSSPIIPISYQSLKTQTDVLINLLVCKELGCLSMCFFIDGGLVAIERVTRQSHYLAGFRDVPEFFCEIEQAKLVFDDRLVNFQHEG